MNMCIVYPIDGHPFKDVEVGDGVHEIVDCFCYLGDMLSIAGGCGTRGLAVLCGAL